MDAEAVGRTAGLKFPEENNLLAGLLDGHMEVPHAGVQLLKVVKLVVMSGEQGLCPVSELMYVFYYRTRD